MIFFLFILILSTWGNYRGLKPGDKQGCSYNKVNDLQYKRLEATFIIMKLNFITGEISKASMELNLSKLVSGLIHNLRNPLLYYDNSFFSRMSDHAATI